jgi:hypothetical protein
MTAAATRIASARLSQPSCFRIASLFLGGSAVTTPADKLRAQQANWIFPRFD